MKRRFPLWFVPAVFASIIFAYAIIQPFRHLRYTDSSFNGESVYSIAKTFMSTEHDDDTYPYNRLEHSMAGFLSRMSDIPSAAPGIQFAALSKHLPQGSPRFLSDIYLSPFYSLVPRVIWTSKPFDDVGGWYTKTVLGLNINSSTAMSPVTYLNFAGGWYAVVIGFFAVGVLQGGIFRGFKSYGTSSTFVIIAMTYFLGRIDSVYYTFFISIIRFLPLVIVAQILIFRRTSSTLKHNIRGAEEAQAA